MGPRVQTNANFAELWLRLAQNHDPGTIAIVMSVQILRSLEGVFEGTKPSLRIRIIDKDATFAQKDAVPAQTPTCYFCLSHQRKDLSDSQVLEVAGGRGLGCTSVTLSLTTGAQTQSFCRHDEFRYKPDVCNLSPKGGNGGTTPPPPPPPHPTCPGREDCVCPPPRPAAEGVCFTGLCNAGLGRIRFHRYKRFRSNPITQEWSVGAQGFRIIPAGKRHRELGRDYSPSLILFNQCLHSKRRERAVNDSLALPHLSAHGRSVRDVVKDLHWQAWQAALLNRRSTSLRSFTF